MTRLYHRDSMRVGLGQQSLVEDEPATVPDEPLNVHQAALELGVSVHTVRAWVARRRLGHLKLSKAIRIPRSEISRMLEENFVPALPEPRAQWTGAKQAAQTAGAARKQAAAATLKAKKTAPATTRSRAAG